jgi:tetratricopeptide (TPR) repeat protein
MNRIGSGSIICLFASCFLSLYTCGRAAQDIPQPVKVYEGTIELPSYEFSGRELQPPLFASSTIQGKYPLPPFKGPFKPGGPKPATYRAIFLENEYLKLTYVPDFGGRIYSLYDKANNREMFYKNDVMKPANYNMKGAFPLFGIELTGPYDSHAITLYGEPLWFNKVIRYDDGSAALIMSTIDPVYRMKVNFTARLYPGLSAMELTVFCYNPRDYRNPYMFWISGSQRATPGTRFIYPMTRTIGHTTSEIADWPVHSGVDYSWDRNNKHMLGVFGIDIYDNFQGAYHHDLDYGVFRFADRRIVQGMKMWTFGYSPQASNLERAYTDNAGPYIEVQSGRYVWDGHYEWLPPHGHEGWSEWWFPMSGIKGLVTTNRDVALNLEVSVDPKGRNSAVTVGLSANRPLPGAKVSVAANRVELWHESADLAPGKPYYRKREGIALDSTGLAGMTVTVTDLSGKVIFSYSRPDTDPGRKEYTPFTWPLEKGQKKAAEMTAEELVLAAEVKLKQSSPSPAMELLGLALARDDGFSRAHLALGLFHYGEGRLDSAVIHLEKVIERDPYAEEAYYYLALSLLEQGDTLKAERKLYFISPSGHYYSMREYILGRLAFLRGDLDDAAGHLLQASAANSYHLNARNLLALIYRLQDKTDLAKGQIEEIEKIDPTNRWAIAERFFLTGREDDRFELLRLLGSQSQEAIEVSLDYQGLGRWPEAVKVLRLVEEENHDPYGTPPIYYYTLAWCLERVGKSDEASRCLEKAQEAGSNVDRFPFRPESVAPLAEAVRKDPADVVARFNLGCLLYYLGRYDEAIGQWEKGVEVNPDRFDLRRALGLAYAERGHGIDKAAWQLEKAVAIDPSHLPTINDLCDLYSRAGRFNEQLAMLEKTLARSPEDDNLVESMITANLAIGRYDQAENLIKSHKFAPRHRSYGLRDKYRLLRYGLGASAFNRGAYSESARQFNLVLDLPVSLGVDNFQFQSSPRLYYYLGRVLEAQGKKEVAKKAYERSAEGWQYLSGDRDSWNSENFFMALALERLGQKLEADSLLDNLEKFARSQLESKYTDVRAESCYLLALVLKKKGEKEEPRQLLEEALNLRPDLLGPRFELRGDVLDPLPQ